MDMDATLVTDHGNDHPVQTRNSVDLNPPFGKIDQLIIDKEPRSGDLCPACRDSKIDYDGLLNLTCLGCGFVITGSCT